jgi:predicted glycoside hydrolase/deacetylase ChbG (UPF0249 family)
VRRLIINADDFGMTTGINRAILEGVETGIITSATLMANSRAFADAVAKTKEVTGGGQRLSVGCHVVLLDGEPLSAPERIPTLLQPGTANGSSRLRDELNGFALLAVRGRLNPGEIETEALAQFDRIQREGIHLSHFDSHKHAHIFPAVLRPLLKAAKARGITAVRNPFGGLFPLPFSRMLADVKLWKRFAEMTVLRSFAARFRREVAKHGLRSPDGSLGVLVTGVLDLDVFRMIADSIPEGTWELVCHPGYNDADLDKVRTRLRASRVKELEVLTSSDARAALDKRGVELITYNQM